MNLSDNFERAAWCVIKAAEICGGTDPLTVLEAAHLIQQFLINDPETIAALTIKPAAVTSINKPKAVS